MDELLENNKNIFNILKMSSYIIRMLYPYYIGKTIDSQCLLYNQQEFQQLFLHVFELEQVHM